MEIQYTITPCAMASLVILRVFIVFLGPLGLVLFPAKALVIVTLHLEQLLEVDLAVYLALQGSVSARTAKLITTQS